jgi:hypothetical protein
MRTLREAILRHELHPKVVHRLPGRLRLRLPAIRRLGDSNTETIRCLEHSLALPSGIESVSLDTRSGSILIGYRPDRLLDSDILGYIESLLVLMVAHRHRIQELHREDWKRVGPKLTRVIAEATGPQLRLEHVEIPDDVWQ